MLLELIELVDKLRGEGGGGAGDWKSMLAAKGIDALPQILDTVKGVFASRATEMAHRARGAAAVAAARSGQPVPQPQFQPQPAPTAPAPVSTAATGAPANRPHVVPPVPNAPGPAWGGPLQVETRGAVPSAADLDAVAAETTAAAATTSHPTPEQAQLIDAYLKTRIVDMVTQGADPGLVLDVIDVMNPVFGALLTHATEAQIRQQLATDPILVAITRLPHYEQFLTEFFAALHADDGAAVPPGRVQ